MSEHVKAVPHSPGDAGLLQAVWKHRLWWMLPLAVLLFLLVAIYALTHLSKTDSEMYPTSSGISITLPYSG